MSDEIPLFEIGDAPTTGVNIDDAAQIAQESIQNNPKNGKNNDSNGKNGAGEYDANGTFFDKRIHQGVNIKTKKGNFKAIRKKDLTTAGVNKEYDAGGEDFGEMVSDALGAVLNSFISAEDKPESKKPAKNELRRFAIVDYIFKSAVNDIVDDETKVIEKVKSFNPFFTLTAITVFYGIQAAMKNPTKTEKVLNKTLTLKVKTAIFFKKINIKNRLNFFKKTKQKEENNADNNDGTG